MVQIVKHPGNRICKIPLLQSRGIFLGAVPGPACFNRTAQFFYPFTKTDSYAIHLFNKKQSRQAAKAG